MTDSPFMFSPYGNKDSWKNENDEKSNGSAAPAKPPVFASPFGARNDTNAGTATGGNANNDAPSTNIPQTVQPSTTGSQLSANPFAHRSAPVTPPTKDDDNRGAAASSQEPTPQAPPMRFGTPFGSNRADGASRGQGGQSTDDNNANTGPGHAGRPAASPFSRPSNPPQQNDSLMQPASPANPAVNDNMPNVQSPTRSPRPTFSQNRPAPGRVTSARPAAPTGGSSNSGDIHGRASNADNGGGKSVPLSSLPNPMASRFKPAKKTNVIEDDEDFLSSLDDEPQDSDDIDNVDWLDSGGEDDDIEQSNEDTAPRQEPSFNKAKMANDIRMGVNKTKAAKALEDNDKSEDFQVSKITFPGDGTGLLPEQQKKVIRQQVRKKKKIPFTDKDSCVLDYLTRWSFATTEMMAQAGGFQDKMIRRLRKRFENYEEMGWVSIYDTFAGPILWYPNNSGAELSTRPWLGGVTYSRINPVSQSHTLGLSSIAAQLYNLTPESTTPDVLHLGEAGWRELAQELTDGDAWLVSEREFRSPYSRIRKEHKGVIPQEYRWAIRSRYDEWRKEYSEGRADLLGSPELEACYPDYEGEDMWLWIVWGNWIWNSYENNGDGGLIPIEDRIVTNTDTGTDSVAASKDMGDLYITADHNPDLVIARKRAADGTARSIAIELELTPKKVDEYARIMAGYFSSDGLTLYQKVIWLVPNITVKKAIEAGISKLYDLDTVRDFVSIVPFYTAERRNSFYSGADIIRGEWAPNGKKIIRGDGGVDKVDHRGGARVHPKKKKD